jgi:hypothetical protein
MQKKTVFEIVSEAYSELEKLMPTEEEIQEYANMHVNDYGVVTYSKSRRGGSYFLRFHDTWKQKSGGRIHIDVGYVDEQYAEQRDVLDTIHLMLNKDYAQDFIEFIRKKRKLDE